MRCDAYGIRKKNAHIERVALHTTCVHDTEARGGRRESARVSVCVQCARVCVYTMTGHGSAG